MKNKYEARLGTERMLPLVFKMALPAVAAQFRLAKNEDPLRAARQVVEDYARELEG